MRPLPPFLRRAAAFLVAFAAALFPATAQAERYGLLVGVATYPLLGERSRLRGPGNDVTLTRAMLLNRGFSASNITVLSDVVPGAGQPTRSAILAGFESIIARAKAGDFVFFLYSGHGSQQPRVERKDGRIAVTGASQTILPFDTASWDDSTGTVRNVLVDHELTALLERLLEKGVFVWSVFDSCHSATLMRGAAGDEVRYRRISPDDLGVPRDLGRGPRFAPAPAPAAAPRAAGGGAAPRGGYVSFYAAQADEVTPDLRLPLDASARRFHGLFIYTIVEALDARESMTYRQVSEYVLGRYAARGLSTPTPLFTGSHLDAPAFGMAQGSAVRQWRIQREGAELVIRAGSLQQVGEGAILAVQLGATAPDGDAIGYLAPVRTEATRARLRPIAFNGRPALEAAKIPADSYARLLRPSVQLGLKVRAPAAPAATDAAAARLAAWAIDALRSAKPADPSLQWVAAGQPADLALHIEEGRVWLLPPDGQLSKEPGPQRTPSLAIEGEQAALQARLGAALQRIARVTNLLRVAQGVGAARGRLELKATVQRGGAGPAEPLDAAATPSLAPGDVVEVSMTNRTRNMLDVTLLFLDADYGIDVFYPSVPGASNRLDAGGTTAVKIAISAGTAGRERLLAIAVQAEPTAPRHDFSYLKQSALEAGRSGASPGGLAGMLDRAAFGASVKARSGAQASFEPAEMRMLSWNTVEKPAPGKPAR